MEFWKDTWKAIKGIFKPFEDFQKNVAKEGSYFLLGISLEGPKGLGWKGALFVWPFVIVLIIAIYLIGRAIYLW